MRFPLSTGMAKNGNFIPVTERNRAIILGPKGNDGNKGLALSKLNLFNLTLPLSRFIFELHLFKLV